ncbi:hypothetical protein D3C78_1564410 [compost metagenome]
MAKRLFQRSELNDRGAWQGPKIVWPEHLQHGMRQFRQVIFELEPQLCGQKGEALQQPLDIGIAAIRAKESCKLRIFLRKTPT